MIIRLIQRFFILLALCLIVVVPQAGTVEQENCGKDMAIEVSGLGVVNEDELGHHIDQIRESLKSIHGKLSRIGVRRDRLMKNLSIYETALQTLYDRMYEQGCTEKRDEATLQTRIQVLEQRIDHAQ